VDSPRKSEGDAVGASVTLDSESVVWAPAVAFVSITRVTATCDALDALMLINAMHVVTDVTASELTHVTLSMSSAAESTSVTPVAASPAEVIVFVLWISSRREIRNELPADMDAD
jgi:hypothetical protein